jgi:hypothetical protein
MVVARLRHVTCCNSRDFGFTVAFVFGELSLHMGWFGAGDFYRRGFDRSMW